MKPLCLGIFENLGSQKDIRKLIVDEFQASVEEVKRFTYLICYVDTGSYEGTGWMLMKDRKTGELFENHNSHCSCYGNEGQFAPSVTHLKYLKSKNFSCYTYGDEEKQIKERISRMRYGKENRI